MAPARWQPASLGEFPIEDDEVCPADAFEDVEPDEEEFHEATGNEGVSFERSYRTGGPGAVAAPRTPHPNQAGLPVTLPVFGRSDRALGASGGDRHSSLWGQAHELAGLMLSTWPTAMDRRRKKSPSAVARMLIASDEAHDTERLDTLLSDIIARGLFNKDDNAAILGALDALSSDRAAAWLEALSPGPRRRRSVMLQSPGARRARCRMAGRSVSAAPQQPWSRPCRAIRRARCRAIRGSSMPACIPTSRSISSGPCHHRPGSGGASRRACLCPGARPMGSIPFWSRPSGFWLSPSKARRRSRGCARLVSSTCARASQSPWRRRATGGERMPVGCKCPRCGELSDFLRDPERKSWAMQGRQADRDHVETTISNAHCDLNVMTERRGSPHSLVCTKNQASYEGRVKQRAKDLADLEQLDA